MFYEYECGTHGVFEVQQGMHDVHKASCPRCGDEAKRIYGNHRFVIDWVNGGFHGEGINFAFNKHFKSTKERDYYAQSHGWEKAGSDY